MDLFSSLFLSATIPAVATTLLPIGLDLFIGLHIDRAVGKRKEKLSEKELMLNHDLRRCVGNTLRLLLESSQFNIKDDSTLSAEFTRVKKLFLEEVKLDGANYLSRVFNPLETSRSSSRIELSWMDLLDNDEASAENNYFAYEALYIVKERNLPMLLELWSNAKSDQDVLLPDNPDGWKQWKAVWQKLFALTKISKPAVGLALSDDVSDFLGKQTHKNFVTNFIMSLKQSNSKDGRAAYALNAIIQGQIYNLVKNLKDDYHKGFGALEKQNNQLYDYIARNTDATRETMSRVIEYISELPKLKEQLSELFSEYNGYRSELNKISNKQHGFEDKLGVLHELMIEQSRIDEDLYLILIELKSDFKQFANNLITATDAHQETNVAFQKNTSSVLEDIRKILSSWNVINYSTNKRVKYWERNIEAKENGVLSKLTIRNQVPINLGKKFFGREKLFSRIDNILRMDSNGNSRLVLAAPPGFGKTRLACEYALRLENKEIVDHVLFLSCKSTGELSRSLAKFCKDDSLDLEANYFGKEFQQSDNQANAVLKWLFNTNDKCLIIVDNVDSADMQYALIESGLLANYFSKHYVLITSRRKDGWHNHDCDVESIEELELHDAIDMILTISKGRIVCNENDQRNASILAEILYKVPLAMEIAAKYISIRRKTLVEYLDLLGYDNEVQNFKNESSRDLFKKIDEQSQEENGAKITNYQQSIIVVYQTSFGELSKSARNALLALSYLKEAEVPRSVLLDLSKKSILNPEADEATDRLNLVITEKDLNELDSFSFINQYTPETSSSEVFITLQPFIREFSRSSMTKQVDLKMFLSGLSRLLLSSAPRDANGIIKTSSSDFDSIGWWSDVLMHAESVLKWADYKIDSPELLDLFIGILDYYKRSASYHKALELASRTYKESESTDFGLDVGHLLINRLIFMGGKDRLLQALHVTNKNISLPKNNYEVKFLFYIEYIDIYYHLGGKANIENALKYARTGKKEFLEFLKNKKASDSHFSLTSFFDFLIGKLLIRLAPRENFKDALVCINSRLDYAKETNDSELDAITRSFLGVAYFGIADFHNSKINLQKSLENTKVLYNKGLAKRISKDIRFNDHPDIGIDSMRLARTLIALEEFSEAEKLLSFAKESIYKRYDKDNHFWSMLDLIFAEYELANGNYEKALDYAEKRIEWCQYNLAKPDLLSAEAFEVKARIYGRLNNKVSERKERMRAKEIIKAWENNYTYDQGNYVITNKVYTEKDYSKLKLLNTVFFEVD